MMTDSIVFDGWQVLCTWERSESGSYPNAPTRVVIEQRLQDGETAAASQGITSTVMRRAEKYVTDYVAERRASLAVATGARSGEFWDAVRRHIDSMPSSPRDKSGDYYSDLLHIFDVLDVAEPHPAQVLAELTGKPLNTVLSQLSRARKIKQAGA